MLSSARRFLLNFSLPTEVAHTLNTLEGATLCGSRAIVAKYCGDPYVDIIKDVINKDGADYDIAAPDTPHNREVLRDNKFFKQSYMDTTRAEYFDSLSVDIFKRSIPCIPHSIKCDVVLKSDMRVFNTVWNAITPEYYYHHIWKRSPLSVDGQPFNVRTDTLRDRKIAIRRQLDMLYTIAGGCKDSIRNPAARVV
jgi:hypothetical protein